MSEEEKKAIELLSKKNTEYYYRYVDVREAVSIVLNLIENQQKEINNIKEIEQLHQEENGKLRVELEKYKRLAEMNLKDVEEFQENMCEHRCILYNEKEELKADLYEANNIISDYIDTTAKQEKMIENVKDRIEYYLMGNSKLDDFYEREKELEKLLKILSKAEENL